MKKKEVVGMMINMMNSTLEVTGGVYKTQKIPNTKIFKDVYFSLKNMKFIKPVIRYETSTGHYHVYKLLCGEYISFSYEYQGNREPAITLEITKIQLTNETNEKDENNGKKGHIDRVKSVKIRTDKLSEITEIVTEEFPKLAKIVEDFLDAIPRSYKGEELKSLITKVYEEDTVNELLTFLDKYDNESLFYQMEID
jgi:hypothetical protein